ncbi:Hint domain-containing protein [Paracoccus sp. M683]|nr:Hint domain-containing protein [Paracoccus sp. M683]
MQVSDDDAALDGIRGSISYDGGLDNDQVLAEDLVLQLGGSGNSVTYAAGTKVGFDFSGKLNCIVDGKIVAVYEVAFPRKVGAGTFGDIMGDSYTVMIIPIAGTDRDGNPLDPVPFDPTKTYYFGGTKAYGTSDHRIDYFQVDCFGTGTMIDTPTGPRPVEALRPGDQVLTRDHGAQVLRWCGHVHVDAARLDLQPNLRPIRIAAGALGPGRPARDLILSPQHRVLVRSVIAGRMFGTDEILVAVKHLLGLPGIAAFCPADGVGYHHLMFDAHQVIRSDGAWSESLYPGPQAMQALSPPARREVLSLFPELAARGYRPQPARPLINGREGRKLAERHGKNRKRLFEPATAN